MSDIFFGEIKGLAASSESPASPTSLKLEIWYPAHVKVAVAEREHLDPLDEWSSSGVYVLLHRPSPTGEWIGYVGKSAASGGVKNRIRRHLSDPDKQDWYRALAVCPVGGEWDEAEVAWLEGSLYRALNAAPNVRMHSTHEPGSGRLSEIRQKRVHKVTDAIQAALSLVGHPVHRHQESAKGGPDEPAETNRRALTPRERVKGIKLQHLVEAGIVPAGTRLMPTSPRWTTPATVTPDGAVEVGGTIYGHLSAAAKSITGRKGEWGWKFWAVGAPDGRTLFDLREDFIQRRQGNEPTAGDNGPIRQNMASEPTEPPEIEPSARHGKLVALLEAGLLIAGTTLVSLDARWPGKGVVTADGQISVAGSTYASPSAAAKALTGRKAESGWTFWAVESDQSTTLHHLRERLRHA